MQRHHVVVAAHVDLSDEYLRHAGTARLRHHRLAGDRICVDPYLGPRMAPALEEVLRHHAIRTNRGGVHGDHGGVGVAQVRSPGTRMLQSGRICGQRAAFSTRFSPVHTPGTPTQHPALMTITSSSASPRRFLPTALAFGLALTLGSAAAQDSRLPDIGSSAGNVLSPAKQAEYGGMVLAQLRHEGYVLEDPLLDGWLRDVGQRLSGSSDRPQQSFTFFLLRDRQINAFATLGGYIGMNAGLILSAEREDEMAGVLAHEIAHVTQQHVLRG